MMIDSHADAWRLSRRQFLTGSLAAAAVYAWPLRRGQNHPPLALTLDMDGSDESAAALWLAWLAERPAWRATFFVASGALTAATRRTPTLWADMLAQGHEIAYLAQPGGVDLDTRRADLTGWQRQLAANLGALPTACFGRPADGVVHPSFVGLCAEAGLLAALWDDAWSLSTPAIVRLNGAAEADLAPLTQALAGAGRQPTTLREYCRRVAAPIPYLAVHASRLPAARPCCQHDFAWLDVPIATSFSTMTI